MEKTLSFEIQRGKFVQVCLEYSSFALLITVCTPILAQVLHSGGNHWVTISSINCKPGHINIDNSLPSGTTCMGTKRQIAAIVHTARSEVVLNLCEVQTQWGSSDCGLFAVAFATTNKDALRSHLISCLEAQPFPRQIRQRKRRNPIQEQEIVPVFCFCCLPESGKMVCCEQCNKWYHRECVHLPRSVKKCCSNCAWIAQHSCFTVSFPLITLVLL